MILCDIMCNIMFSLCVSWFIGIGIILTTNSTIDESSGVLKVDLSLDKPSPCCFHVYVETIDKGADGKLQTLYEYVCVCVCICVCICVYMCVYVCVYVCVCVCVQCVCIKVHIIKCVLT